MRTQQQKERSCASSRASYRRHIIAQRALKKERAKANRQNAKKHRAAEILLSLDQAASVVLDPGEEKEKLRKAKRAAAARERYRSPLVRQAIKDRNREAAKEYRDKRRLEKLQHQDSATPLPDDAGADSDAEDNRPKFRDLDSDDRSTFDGQRPLELKDLRRKTGGKDVFRLAELDYLDDGMRKWMGYKTEGDFLTAVCADFARSYDVGLAEALCSIQRRSRRFEEFQVTVQEIRDDALQFFGGAVVYEYAEEINRRLGSLIGHLSEIEILAADDVDYFLGSFCQKTLGFQVAACFKHYPKL